MFSWVGIQAKLAVAGAFALAVLAVVTRLKVLKHQRDRARGTAAILTARAIVQKTNQKIKREEEGQLLKELASIEKELEKDEDFQGVDNLTDSNKF